MEMFGQLYGQAAKHLPKGHAELGDLGADRRLSD